MKIAELTSYLKLNAALDKPLLDEIVSKFSRNQLETGKFLLRKGQVADSYYFIEKGFLRSYYINKDKEHTLWIEAPGELVCEIKSMRLRQPTEFYMQAMEPVTYLSIKATVFDDMVEAHKDLQKFMLKLWETRFMIALDGLRAFQTMDAKNRYDFVMNHFPHFKMLSLSQLAALLGITQSSLSRIRKPK